MSRAGILVVAAITLTSAAARADERHTAIDLEAGVGVVLDNDTYDPYAEPESITMLRGRVAWEQAPVAYPVERGYAWGGSVVPELALGMLDHLGTGEGFVQAGARLELRFAQKEMGLLRVSARGGLWFAGRAGVIGERRDPMWEGALGWYMWLGNSPARLGWEMGVLGIHGQPSSATPVPGAIAFDTGVDRSASAFHFTIFVGGRLGK